MSLANLKCPECPYDKGRNMGTHLFFVHGYSKTRITEWRMVMKTETLARDRDIYDIFRCAFCPKTYKRQNSCRAHERVVHCVSSSNRQKCVPCPIRNCHFTTTALLDLCAHAKERHSEMGDFSIREARFENLQLFHSWRLQYEEASQTVLATESVNSNAAAGTTLRYLRCAQLEAQIRKVRNQMRKARNEVPQEERGESVYEDEGGEGEEEEEQIEVEERKVEVRETRGGGQAGQEMVVSGIRRSPRKRQRDPEEGYVEEEYGRRGQHPSEKRVKEEKEEERKGGEDEEEEEIDVEQLDEDTEEDARPSTSAAVLLDRRGKRVTGRVKEEPEEYEERGKHEVREVASPRLVRASSAHLDNDAESLLDMSEQARLLAGEAAHAEKRMNSRHCTAHMRVLVLRTGAVHVEYCEAHLGHEVIAIPPVPRRGERAGPVKPVKPMANIPRDVEAAIEAAKQRRKGRRETEHRWQTERRARTERENFARLCNNYDDIGANVELYEGGEGDDVSYEGEDEGLLEVEEIIEEEVVDHEELIDDDDVRL